MATSPVILAGVGSSSSNGHLSPPQVGVASSPVEKRGGAASPAIDIVNVAAQEIRRPIPQQQQQQQQHQENISQKVRRQN